MHFKYIIYAELRQVFRTANKFMFLFSCDIIMRLAVWYVAVYFRVRSASDVVAS